MYSVPLIKVPWPVEPGWYIHPNSCEWFLGPYKESSDTQTVLSLCKQIDPYYFYDGLTTAYVAEPEKIKTIKDFWDCCHEGDNSRR